MASWMIAIVLKPIFPPLFFYLVVAPIAWSLHRFFPEGKVRTFLFRVRTTLMSFTASLISNTDQGVF